MCVCTAHQDRVGDRNLDMQRIATNITTHELSKKTISSVVALL